MKLIAELFILLTVVPIWGIKAICSIRSLNVFLKSLI